MGGPAPNQPPEPPAPDFESIISAAAEWRKAHRVPELSEEEAMRLAVEEQRAERQERAKRLGQ